jgi:hypothetical protein
MNREVEIKPDMVFGMLTTIKPLTGSKGGAQWFCQCECGNRLKDSPGFKLQGFFED